ncbi:ketopantoate reductase family protein [Agarivorans sp. DSG3-1]|uniref:ketopantoate reductase family protein n=1 Tax=Agarivorans sp. DSG3-1 TaxID=3342249 RepID=UPI00398E7F52
MYHCAIIGAGAVGGLLAALLSQHSKVCFVDPRIVRESSLALTLTPFATDKSTQLHSRLPLLNTIPSCRWLIICVKAHQVASAVAALTIPADCKVILMVNGLGAHQDLINQLNPEQLYLASNTHGALVLSKSQQALHIKHTGLGKIDLGSYLGNSEPDELSLLNEALAPLDWHNNIYPALWLKLAINCCINPLTAIHNCPNGDLLNSNYQQTLEALCQELSLVAEHEGITLSTEYLLQTVRLVAQNTAANYSSMHQDIHHQRTSEINYINAYVLQRAKQFQLHCPYNKKMLEQIKKLEQQYD